MFAVLSEQLSVLQHFHPQDFWVTVHAWHQPQPDGPSYRLRHTPLVHRTQASLVAVPDAAHVRHVFAHNAEIFVVMQGVDAKLVEHVRSRLWLALHALPLGHLGSREIMWCVHVAGPPTARLLLLQLFACVSARHIFQLLLPLSLLACSSDFPDRVARDVKAGLPLLGGDGAW